MALYHFVTDIRVASSIEQVWAALEDPTAWPAWWRWLRRVDVIDRGGADGLGGRYRLMFRTALPYTLSFESETVRVVRPSLLESRATGELAGSGLWQLAAHDDVTHLRYTWIVRTTKRWMNIVAALARPAFSWNHDVLMRDFAAGLARHLGTDLVSVENRAVKAGATGFGQLPQGSDV